MIIQCSACRTRFRLADDKVKAEGTRVRCSRCGQVFAVFPPTSAAGPEGVAAPSAKPAAPGAAGYEDWSDVAAESAQAKDAAPRSVAPPPAPATDEDADNDGGASLDAAFADIPAGEPAAAAFDFDAFSFDDEEDSPAAEADAGVDPVPASFAEDWGEGGETETADFGAADDAGQNSALSSTVNAPSTTSATEADDLPWQAESRLDNAPQEFEFGSLATPEEAAEEQTGEDAGGAETEPPPERPTRPASARPHPSRQGGRRKQERRWPTYLLIVLLLGLCAGAGYLYWSGRLPELGRQLDRLAALNGAAATSASKIRIEGLNGYFVNNRQAGQLFVVDGLAVNGYAEPRSALAVRGLLYAPDGDTVQEAMVYCGNQLSAKELQTLPWARIKERSENQFGDSLSNLNLDPGKSLPFTIVFQDLPPELAEFAVEPADSLPGSK